jgi:hypothetical protein
MTAKQKEAWTPAKKKAHGEKIRAAIAARKRRGPMKRSSKMSKLVGSTPIAQLYDRYDAAAQELSTAKAALIAALASIE